MPFRNMSRMTSGNNRNALPEPVAPTYVKSSATAEHRAYAQQLHRDRPELTAPEIAHLCGRHFDRGFNRDWARRQMQTADKEDGK